MGGQNITTTAKRWVGSKAFERTVTGLIFLTALLIGLDTSETLKQSYGFYINLAHAVLLALFLAELGIRYAAVHPNVREFLSDPWNVYDLVIAVLSLMPWDGEYAIIGRLLRILRVVRLVARFVELRLIVGTLLRSLPSMGHILILLSLVFYVYAIMGYHTLHNADPQHFGTLGTTMLTLFRIMTLEDWTDVMYIAMEYNRYSWIYFISFVVITAFVVINMFIAVVLSNLAETKIQQQNKDMQFNGEDTSVEHAIELMRAAIDAYDRARKPQSSRESSFLSE